MVRERSSRTLVRSGDLKHTCSGMKALFGIFYYTLVMAALGLGALLILLQTDIVPGYEVRIVMSGSMEPAIPTGSIVVVQAREQYAVGDVITFGDDSPGGLPTTHRIIDTILQDGELAYITQGDANESPDLEPTRADSVRGAVLVHVPFLGYILDFARQPLGFALMIGVPAALIAIEEIGNIYRAIVGRKEDSAPTTTDNKEAADDEPDNDSSDKPPSTS